MCTWSHTEPLGFEMKSHIFTLTLLAVVLAVVGFPDIFHLTPYYEIEKLREVLRQFNKTQKSSSGQLLMARQTPDLKIAPNVTASTTTTTKPLFARATAATTAPTTAATIAATTAATPSATVVANAIMNSTNLSDLHLVVDDQTRGLVDFITDHWEVIATAVQSVVEAFYC